MTEALPAHSTGGASRDDEGATATRGLARWLCLAATPTFAIMALLTGLGGSPMDGLCWSGHGATLSGMVTMYLLMSAFHSPPWLNLLRPARPQSDGRRIRLLDGVGPPADASEDPHPRRAPAPRDATNRG